MRGQCEEAPGMQNKKQRSGSMRYIISGKNIDITDGLRSAVTDKLKKLERYFTPDTEVACNSERGEGTSEDRSDDSGKGEHYPVRAVKYGHVCVH